MLKGLNLKSRFNRVFIKFLSSFIIVFLVPVLVLGTMSYFFFSHSSEQQVEKYNDLILNKSASAVDEKINSIKNIMVQMVFTVNVNSDDYSGLSELRNRLIAIKSANPIIDEIIVYQKNSNVITDHLGQFNLDFFIENNIKPRQMTTEDFKKLINERNELKIIPIQVETASGMNSEQLFFVMSYPLFNGEIRGTQMISISADYVKNMMEPAAGESEGVQVLIMNPQEELVTTTNFNQDNLPELRKVLRNRQGHGQSTTVTLDGNTYLLTTLDSLAAEWTYIVLTPMNHIQTQANFIRLFTIGICLVLFFVGIILAIFISRNLTKPIYKMIDVFQSDSTALKADDNKTRFNEFDYIIEHITFVLKNNQYLQSNEKNREKYIQDYYVKSLLLGNESKITEASIESMKSYFQLPYFSAIVLRIFPATEPIHLKNNHELKAALVEDIEALLEQSAEILGILTSINNNVISILVNYQNPELLKDSLLSKISFRGVYADHFILIVGVGTAKQDIRFVNDSYSEAVYATRFRKMNQKSQTIHHEQLTNDEHSFYFYSMEEENRMIWEVATGSDDSLDIAEQWLNQRIHEEDSYDKIVHFFITLRETIKKIMMKVQMSEAAEEEVNAKLAVTEKNLDTWNDISDFRKQMIELFKVMVSNIQERTRGSQGKLKDELLTFIHDNFNDPDLSLDRLADQFHMSAKYISRFFKDQTGMNYTDYINQYRIKKSKELLRENPNVHIRQLAEAMGVLNVNTFISVFKKYEGVTPGKYRQMEHAE